MSLCISCGESTRTNRDLTGELINYVPAREGFCDYCKIMIPCITGHEADQISGSKKIQEARGLLGHPNTKPRQIWNRIRDCSTTARDWFPFTSNQDHRWAITERPPEWELLEEDLAVLSKPDSRSGDLEQMRRLQRGGTLPDGSYLSWIEGEFYLDGISVKIPYLGLSKILKKNRGIEGINWKSLLLSISVAVTRYNEQSYGRSSGRFAVTHPAHLLLFEPRPNSPWAQMMRRRDRGRGRGGIVNVPLEEVEATKWMRLWRSWLEGNSSMATQSAERSVSVPVSLFISDAGRLQLRVRRDHGWRKLEVGSHPETWSNIVTWALSPPGHDYRERFQCIQQSLFADPDSPVIPEEDRKGICLLRNVVQSNDRAESNVSLKSFRITGESGLRYLVRPGTGAHGTRFTVWGYGSRGVNPQRYGDPEELMFRGGHHDPPICIVETPDLRRLVIGDAVASVVMALLDDVNSSKSIDTLRNHISSNRRIREELDNPDIGHLNEARLYENRLRLNRVADRVRRFTESFPTLWGVLLRLPLGERMTFRAMRQGGGRPNIQFDDCETQFSSRSLLERRAIYMMLESSGWTRDREEERVRGEQRIYIRTGTGERELGDSVREISQILEPELRINGRIHMIQRQLWTYFERVNPGPSALLPGSDQNIE